jgi:4-hydroxybenzoate polyprenyltransferase
MVADMMQYLELIRAKQWYKNLVIFLPLFFGRQLFSFFPVQQTLIGFFALCMISSANYILNDITDREKDRLHPRKRLRPIAAGNVSLRAAFIVAALLLFGGMLVSFSLSRVFSFFSFGLFASTQLYTFVLKREPFADILGISLNFVIRTIAGAFVITEGLQPYVQVSAWLILCPFFFALFLASAKRNLEQAVLKRGAKAHRSVLAVYTKEVCFALLIISTTLVLISYSLYVFFSPYPRMMYTIPFAVYIIFKLFAMAQARGLAKKSFIELIDIGLVISGLIAAGLVFWAIY